MRKKLSPITLILPVLRLLLGLLVFSGFSTLAQESGKAVCLVSGTVFDLQDAVVSGSRVVFRSRLITRVASADRKGHFQTSLEPGRYEVLIVRGVEFWNYMRSEIEISCGSPTVINFYVLPECVSYGCERLGSHFDVITKEKSENDIGPNLVIAYLDRKRKGDNLVYLGAVLTFKEYTVKAREIRLNTKAKKLVAKGGWMESGNTRQTFDEREIEIANTLLASKFKSSTISDIKNIRGLRKLHREMKESKILK